ncbi:MAG: serine/threonine-protein kinase [Planctomycetota bacterium]
MGKPPLGEIERAFELAIQAPPDERAEFARARFATQPELLAEVLKLLESEQAAGGFMSTPAFRLSGAQPTQDNEDLTGTSLGGYTISSRLGIGGMGSVWTAERTDIEFDRRVAVKVVRAGADRLVPRFRLEQRALASLEHPGIARLIDVTELPDGRPAIIMELVEGVPIDQHCEDTRLGIADRVKLFIGVCDAVAHAHRRLIVHRDLKPSNILVSTSNEPKLIDFGIAKLLDHDPILTATEQRILTPRYASPEQVRGEPVGVAADVYSLGVVLYELLTGSNPHDEATTSGAPMQQVICEHTPPRPSTAVTRATTEAPHRLKRQLAGDLDVIVMAALRKEPDRRYTGADALADDLRRYLENRPVAARPDSVAYRVAKFTRRNAGLVVSSALGITAVASALVVISLLLVDARAAEQRQAELAELAESRANDAEAITSFLQGMLASATPDRAAGQDPEVLRQMLRSAEIRLETGLEASPGVRAEIERTLGSGYREIGELERASRRLSTAERLGIEAHGEQSIEVALIRTELAALAMDQGEFALASELIEQAMPMLQQQAEQLPARIGSAFGLSGMVYAMQRQPERARESFSKGAALLSSTLAPSDRAVLSLTANRASLEFMMGDTGAAELLLRNAIRSATEDDQPLSIGLLGLYNNLSVVLSRSGRSEEALAEYANSIELSTQLLGPDHPATLKGRSNRAALLSRVSPPAEGEAALREVFAAQSRTVGADHIDSISTLFNLARHLLKHGDPFEAADMFEQCIEVQTATVGPNHPETAMSKASLAEALLAGAGSGEQAEPLLLEARAVFEATMGPNAPPTQTLYTTLRTLYGPEHLDRPDALGGIPGPGVQSP